jgi:hypothetical protein
VVEAPATIEPQSRRPWQFTLRGLFLLTFSVALGLSFWKTEQNWYSGALVAISFWIVLGLAAQVRDLWRSSQAADAMATEDRWGRRFAVAWRLAACLLIAAYVLVCWLARWNLLSLSDHADGQVIISSRGMCDAVLITVIIAAIASSPRFARPRRRPWSWATGFMGGIAAGAVLVLLLVDKLTIPFLVHITIVDMQMSFPLWLTRDVTAASSAARLARFLDVTTAGVVSILVSGVMLRLVALRWRQGGPARTCLGVLLAASLCVMVVLAGVVVLVEVPTVAPVFAANIPLPTPYQLGAGVVLVLLLASTVACRWSAQTANSATGIPTWHCDQTRYHHENRLLLWLLGSVALTQCAIVGIGLVRQFGLFAAASPLFAAIPPWSALGYLVEDPLYCLSLAVVLLAVQGVAPRWSRVADAAAAAQPRLAPGLFLLIWCVILIIIACSAPILAAWGFALRLGVLR